MPPISAYILARNEAQQIALAIQSVSWANEIIVVDTGSEDNTQEIAREQGAKIVNIPFNGFGPCRNQALTHCSNDWILCIDADERCSAELKEEIIATLAAPKFNIYLAPRRNFFLGREIKHSGWYPDYRHPVLFNKHYLRYSDDKVHETYLTAESTGYLKSALIHYPYVNLTKMLAKSNQYSTLGVARLTDKTKRYGFITALNHASWCFIRQYIFRAGFLDGWPGFILALNAFYATFFRYAKYVEQMNHENTAYTI